MSPCGGELSVSCAPVEGVRGGEAIIPEHIARLRMAFVVAAAAPMLFIGGAVSAQDVVEQVTVTSARLPEAVGSPAFSTVTLDAEQLSTSDRLDDALEQVPGLSLFRRTVSNSSNASTQGVSLRAIAPSGTSRALVMLDGVPLNDPFGGWVIWTPLPYEDIGGAEVIRGAGAGPYGAGALTGTILLTERASDRGVIDGEVGSLSSARAGASQGEQLGDVDLFALDKPRLERFGQHSAAGEPANELHPGLATTIGAARKPMRR